MKYLFLGFSLAIIAGPLSLASAQEDDFDSTVREGLREFEAGHWVEARTLFLRAHGIRPSAEALRMAGNASYEERQYVQAVTLLDRALAASEGPLRADRVPLAQEALEAAERFVTRVTVSTSNSRVRLDERPIDPNTPAVVLRGEHTVEVSGDGFETYRETIRLNEPVQRVNIVLQPARVTNIDDPGQNQLDAEPESNSRKGLWIGLGVGAGVLLVAVIVAATLIQPGTPGGADAPDFVVYAQRPTP